METDAIRARRRKFIGRLFAACALALALGACKTLDGESPDATGSIGSSGVLTASDLSPDQALAAVQKWGAIYSKAPKDKIAALNYSAALRAAGETKQAVAVMRKATIYNPTDREVLATFGKALAADGQFQEALSTVQRAQRTDNPDWQLLATEGGILDSLGEHEKARERYRQALVLAPGEPQILNNMGMSYTLTNEIGLAEEALRQAVANPRATLKMRQNLELVLTLKGTGGKAAKVAEAPGLPRAAADEAAPAAVPQEDIWEELENS